MKKDTKNTYVFTLDLVQGIIGLIFLIMVVFIVREFL